MILLKTAVDKKSGMLMRQYQFGSTGAKVRFYGELNFGTRAMYALAKFALATMLNRVSKAIGSNDQPMKPLKKGYAIHKTRLGRGNKRNLLYSGDMLRNISIRSVSEYQARIDLTSAKQRMKARQNEVKSPWYGWSPNDIARMSVRAQQLYRGRVSEFGFVSSSSARNAQPIWMDPLGIRAAPSGRLAA
jgi:hypothetical protein